jgi:hypothetical protein
LPALSLNVTANRVLGDLSGGRLQSLVEVQNARRSGVLGRYKDGEGPGSPSSNQLNAVQQVAGLGADGLAAVAGVLQMKSGGGAASGGGRPVSTTEGVSAGGNAAVAGFTKVGMDYESITHGGIQVANAANLEAGFANRRALDPMNNLTYSNMEAMASQRVSSGKALQGRHWEAAGKGMAGNLDFGQSTGMAEGFARQFGLTMAMGYAGDEDSAASGKRKRLRAQAKAARGMGDTASRKSAAFQKIADDLKGSDGSQWGGSRSADEVLMLADKQAKATAYADSVGVADQTADSLEAQARGVKGAHQGKTLGLVDYAIQMQKMGMDASAAGGMVGRFGESMQTRGEAFNDKGKLDAAGAGFKQWEAVFAKGIQSGLKEMRFFEEMGRAVSDSSFGTGGALGGAGERAGYMFAGGPQNMHEFQAAEGAAAKTKDLYQNNPYYNMVQTSAAIDVMSRAGNASGSALRALQQSSPEELLVGSPYLSDVGVSVEQSRKVLSLGNKRMLGSHHSANQPELDAVLAMGDDDYAAGLRGSPEARRQARINMTGNLGYDRDEAMMAVSSIASIGGEVTNLTPAEQAFMDEQKKGKGGDLAGNVINTQMKVLFETLSRETGSFAEKLTTAAQNVTLALQETKKQNPDSPDFEGGEMYLITVSESVKMGGHTKPKGGRGDGGPPTP